MKQQNDYSGSETTRLIKFVGNNTKWAEWSVNALSFAKSKDFKDAFIGNTAAVFTDTLYNTSPGAADVKDAYKRDIKAINSFSYVAQR